MEFNRAHMEQKVFENTDSTISYTYTGFNYAVGIEPKGVCVERDVLKKKNALSFRKPGLIVAPVQFVVCTSRRVPEIDTVRADLDANNYVDFPSVAHGMNSRRDTLIRDRYRWVSKTN